MARKTIRLTQDTIAGDQRHEILVQISRVAKVEPTGFGDRYEGRLRSRVTLRQPEEIVHVEEDLATIEKYLED